MSEQLAFGYKPDDCPHCGREHPDHWSGCPIEHENLPPTWAGRQRRDEALERVERNADASWMLIATAAVRVLAYRGAEFTTDDVWDYLEREVVPAQRAPHEPRAMGAVMRNAALRGIATPSNRTRVSARPECHARPVRVWQPAARGLRTRE